MRIFEDDDTKNILTIAKKNNKINESIYFIVYLNPTSFVAKKADLSFEFILYVPKIALLLNLLAK